jgi:hypothetical protein
MSVLSEPAIAQLGRAEHSLDNSRSDARSWLAPSISCSFSPAHCRHDTAVAGAAADEVLRSRRMSADRRLPGPIGLIAPHACLVAMQKTD